MPRECVAINLAKKEYRSKRKKYRIQAIPPDRDDVAMPLFGARFIPTSAIATRHIRPARIVDDATVVYHRLFAVHECCCLDMTNTGKVLVIGLLVIDAGVAGYLLFPKDEQRAPTATGVVVGSVDDPAPPDSPGGSARATGGVVMPEVPAKPALPPAPAAPVNPVTPPGAADKLAMAPPSPALPAADSVPPQPAPPAVDSTAPTSPAPAPTTATAVAPARSVAPDSGQVAAGRIANAAPPAAHAAASAHTKPQPGPRRIEQAQAHRRAGQHPNGSNPVAALLTDQLVRESAKPDPSLPMPSGIGVQSMQTPPGQGSNPVASAMTDQLVRESSRVAPMQQSPNLKH
ncbi:hypothetical protein [Paraburkholderia sp.]|uniref:hypothetical protein n=1 Tax=Paraburkholderia sp. TaxID=1926495 RepID=UPI0039E21C08